MIFLKDTRICNKHPAFILIQYVLHLSVCALEKKLNECSPAGYETVSSFVGETTV